MDSSLQVFIATELSELPLTAQNWNALVALASTKTVFQSYEWFEAWWRTFGSDHRLYIVAVQRQEKVVAFAPLMLTIESMGLRKLEFVGAGNADYMDFCYPSGEPELLRPMFELLQKRRADWDVLRLANLPLHSSTFANLPALVSKCRVRLLHEATVSCPTLVLKGRVEEVRKMIDKYSVRRKINWFGKHGELKVLHLIDADDIDAHLDSFFLQHTHRWKISGVTSQFERQQQREFFKRLTRSLCAERALIFTVVTLNRESLAYHFGFQCDGRIIWYKPSFNPRFAARSPGVVLMRSLIEEALRLNLDEFDYTVGPEAFKFRFSNTVRANAYVNIYHGRARHSVALAYYVLRAIARGIVRSLRTALRLRPAHLES